MDKLAFYADLIKRGLHEHLEGTTREDTVEALIICDDTSRNYLLVTAGWTPGMRHHSIIFHARIRDGKVLLEWDGTDPSISEWLLENGLARTDMRMGWADEHLQDLLEQQLLQKGHSPRDFNPSSMKTLLDIIEPDKLASLRIVGLDITGSSKKKTGYCLLEGLTASTRRLSTDDELVEAIIQDKPTLVTIDSPLTLPRGRLHVGDDDPTRATHGIIRQCERDLRKRGIHVFWPLMRDMQPLTARGITLAGRLRNLGFEVIEVFPGGAQDVMSIPRKQKGHEALQQHLIDWGLQGTWQTKRVSHDELDAITAAMVGLFYLTDNYEAIGDADEGQIILPSLTKPDDPATPAPSA